MSNVRPDLQNPRYRDTRTKRILAALAVPVFSFLNRSAFRRVSEAVYDVALRWNGFAIGFKGKYGLTHPEEAFLRDFLPKIKSGALLDVGANHGTYARFLNRVRPDLRVLAFEPHPKSFALLTETSAQASVELYKLALSDTTGPMKIFDFSSQDGSTQASLSQDALQLFETDTVEYEIECTTLDAFSLSQGLDHIAFLKIDTEGFDINVLRGSRRLLEEKRIDVIQFEFIPACIVLRVTMRDFFEVLRGYKLYRLCVNGGLLPLEYNVKRCEVYVVHNLIAIRDGFAI
jgi:FkbM family methyltransferase